MTSITAVFALVPQRVKQEIGTECTQHELIELALDELVPIHLVDFVFALSHSTLTSEAANGIQGPLANVLLDYYVLASSLE
jgi:hypothetical protein